MGLPRFLIVAAVALSAFSPSAAASMLTAQNPDSLRSAYQHTLDTYEQELAAVRKQDTTWRWQEVSILNGIAYRYFGNYQKSIDVLQQALSISRSIPDRAREEGILRELAVSHSKLGDAEGGNFLRRELQQVRQQGDLQSERIILKTLGIAYLSLGNYIAEVETFEQYLKFLNPQQDGAEILLVQSMLSVAYGQLKETSQQLNQDQQQLTAARALQDKNLERNALIALASNYRSQGQNDKALETYQTLLKLTQLHQDDQMQILTLQWLAGLSVLMGKPIQSIETLQKSIAIARQTNNLFLAGFSTKALGRVYFLLKRYEQAAATQKQAISLFHQFYQNESGSSLEADSMVNLALTLSKMGQWAEAERLLRQSQAIYKTERQAVNNNINLLSLSQDELNLSQYETTQDSYRLLQQVLIAQNQPEKALEVAEAGRAQAFAQLLATRLGVESAAQADAAPLSLEQIRRVAKTLHTTLVEYSILYNDVRVAEFSLGNQVAQPIALLVWVIQPTGNVSFRQVDLKPSQQQNLPLQALVRDARRDLGAIGRGSQPSQRPNHEPLAENLSGLERLHQHLIQPIADLLPTDPNAHVTFIPQDALFLAPFAALKDRRGNYLIEKHTILVAPSIQALDLFSQRPAQHHPPANFETVKALIVGNPVMPRLQHKPNVPAEALPNLPGAEQEARAIAQLLHTHPLLGAAATEAAVTAKMGKADIIHLATHGILDNIRGLQSSLALTPGDNQNITAEDGFLTAREVSKLNLMANLVVLSACNTGRGIINGDGVVGLSRSFMAAGVPSLVVSLWAVPDTPTAALVTEFYRNLHKRMDKAQALRQAMLTTMKQHPKPLNWAGFILLGKAD
jgi:CHAT domain-containing protein